MPWHPFHPAMATAVVMAVVVGASAPRPAAGRSPESTDQATVTYNRDVAPILLEHCTPCHRPGEAAPFDLLTFDDARRRAHQIVEVTQRRLMPPWQPEPGFGEFEGARRLSVDEMHVLEQWVSDDTPEGDPADLPSMPDFAEGWQLGQPDLIVRMPETYTVSAGGGDIFRNFVLPVSLKTRRYVRAVEFRPGNPRVVHHARVLIDDTRELRRRDAQEAGPGFGGMEAPGTRFPDGHFLGWAPGKMPSVDPLAWPLEPGSDLVVQVHLKPTGRLEPVRASIGLYFTDEAPETPPVMLVMGARTIDIPAGEHTYIVSDSFTLPVDARALRIYPHAHYLARDMTVLVRMPDHSVQGLLHITDWDFNWQDEYAYARPVDLPQGATIIMRYIFDNSSTNPQNPNSPPLRVTFGPETTDEMAELLVQLLPARPEDAAVLRAAAAHASLLTAIAGEEKRIADVPDDYAARNSLGVHYVQLGEVDKARASLNAALRVNPEYAPAHYNLGVVAISRGRNDEAIGHFERAVALRPDYVEAHTNLGALLQRGGRNDEAAGHLARAIEANPDHFPAHYNLAQLRLGQGALRQAIAELRESARLRPRDASILDTLASAYQAVGESDLALRTLDEAIDAALAADQTDLARTLRQKVDLFQQPSAFR